MTKSMTAWIRLVATEQDRQLLAEISRRNGDAGFSATVRRLIRDEAHRLGTVSASSSSPSSPSDEQAAADRQREWLTDPATDTANAILTALERQRTELANALDERNFSEGQLGRLTSWLRDHDYDMSLEFSEIDIAIALIESQAAEIARLTRLIGAQVAP